MPQIVTPAVIVPRFSTFVGATNGIAFTTLPVEITAYESARITGWRGPIAGTGGPYGFGFTFQESTDRNVWTTCPGTTPDDDPGAVTELLYSFLFSKKWFCMTVRLAGANRSSASRSSAIPSL